MQDSTAASPPDLRSTEPKVGRSNRSRCAAPPPGGAGSGSTAIQSTRACTKCGERKPLEDFILDRRRPSGRGSRCKACQRALSADHYGRNQPAYIERNRRYRDECPAQAAAHRAVRQAVKEGWLIPRSCECGCGTPAAATVAHHDDYAPECRLQVRWLCATAHMDWHAKNGPGRNADTPQPRSSWVEYADPLNEGRVVRTDGTVGDDGVVLVHRASATVPGRWYRVKSRWIRAVVHYRHTGEVAAEFVRGAAGVRGAAERLVRHGG